MSNAWSRPTKYIVGVALGILAIYVLYLSRSIITLFIIAALIAFLVRPLIAFFHRRLRLPNGIAVLISYLLVTVLILLGPLVLLPPIVDAVSFILNLDYQVIINNALDWFRNTLMNLSTFQLSLLNIQINLESFIEPILTALQNTEPVFSPQLPPLTTLLNSVGSAFSASYGFAVGFVGTLFSTILGFTFMLMAGIYLSLDGDKLYDFILDMVPEAYRKEFDTLLKKIEHIWDSFFRGQVTLMVLIGVIVWLGGSLLGLPGAFALGIVAGLLEIIPNLGPVLSTIPALVVALLQGSNTLQVDNMTFMFIVLGFYVLVQQVENYFIVPRVLGQAVDLHPLVVLTGVLVGASIAGILGALLASPVLASSMTIVGYLYRKMRDLDPFPPKEDPDDEEFPPFEKQIQLLTQKITKFLKRVRKSN